jgi:hypothetical protein
MRGDVDQGHLDELLAFAVDCAPDVKRLPLHEALASHTRLGPRSMGWLFTEKVQWWLRRRAWTYRGY